MRHFKLRCILSVFILSQVKHLKGSLTYQQLMFSVFETSITLHISLSTLNITQNLEALLELGDMSVANFSILQAWPSFGDLKC